MVTNHKPLALPIDNYFKIMQTNASSLGGQGY